MRRRREFRIAEGLFGCLFPGRDTEFVLGDLQEEYLRRCNASRPLTVSFWYWKQIARSILPLLGLSLHQRGWLGTAGIALAAFLIASGLEFLLNLAIAGIWHTGEPVPLLYSTLTGLSATGFCGYFGTLMRRGTAFVLAGITVLFVAALILIDAGTAPLWYALVFLVMGPIASISGGFLYAIRKDHRSSSGSRQVS